MDKKARPTIGLFLPPFHEGTQALWSAAEEAAQEQNVNLICFISGGQYGSIEADAVFDLVSPTRFDALIIPPGNLWLHDDDLDRFFSRFKSFPIISMGAIQKGIPSIIPDNYQGMRDLVSHLVRVHGCHKIVYIHGPAGVKWAEDRFRGYAEALNAHNLFNADLVFSLGDDWRSADHVLRLLDERELRPGQDFDALVICANDLLASEVMERLQLRGVRVPGDITITGFNDDAPALSSSPPLTTINQPLKLIGRRSVEMALAAIRGKKLPLETVLPQKLVVRRSCGCPSPSTFAEEGWIGRAKDNIHADISQNELAQKILETTQTSEDADPRMVEQVVSLISAIHQPGPGSEPHKPNLFLATLEKILDKAIQDKSDILQWSDILTMVRAYVCDLCSLRDEDLPHENLWHQARVIFEEASQRVFKSQQVRSEHETNALRQLGIRLIGALNIERMVEILATDLPQLGIPSAYLALYESPCRQTEWARVVLAYDLKQPRNHPHARKRFLSSNLVPLDTLPHKRRYTFIVEPIYFGDCQMGFAVFEVGLRVGAAYDALASQISSVLRAENLYEEALKARAVAEKADHLKTRLLANVSHELRAPLHVILGHSQAVLNALGKGENETIQDSMSHIQANAEHQLRMVNDLLDLSRAEIDSLNLSPALIDPRTFLEEAFYDLANSANVSTRVSWRLQLPAHLPAIHADPNRLRQILYNLLSNASKATQEGQIILGAEAAPPYIHFWVEDTGMGIPVEQQEHIFQPFITLKDNDHRPDGIGLGLSITRRLISLHNGTITLESTFGKGSIFHVYLPIPSSDTSMNIIDRSKLPAVLLAVSRSENTVEEVQRLARNHGLGLRFIRPGEDLTSLLKETRPVMVAWDRSSDIHINYLFLVELRNQPDLCHLPIIFYGREPQNKNNVGLTNVFPKPLASATLRTTLDALLNAPSEGSILVVDDDPQILDHYARFLREEFPLMNILRAEDGLAAITVMRNTPPRLVLLDLSMPKKDGYSVLEWMRKNPSTQNIPVLILSGQILSFENIKRIEGYSLVRFQSKEVFSLNETSEAINNMLSGNVELSPSTSNLVKRAVAFFNQNYHRALSRQEVAKTLGVNEDYLSEIFSQEMGLSPWEYLNRFRVSQAKNLLSQSSSSITLVALKVGFNDSAYFSRVFHKITGVSPREYRQNSKK